MPSPSRRSNDNQSQDPAPEAPLSDRRPSQRHSTSKKSAKQHIWPKTPQQLPNSKVAPKRSVVRGGTHTSQLSMTDNNDSLIVSDGNEEGGPRTSTPKNSSSSKSLFSLEALNKLLKKSVPRTPKEPHSAADYRTAKPASHPLSIAVQIDSETARIRADTFNKMVKRPPVDKLQHRSTGGEEKESQGGEDEHERDGIVDPDSYRSEAGLFNTESEADSSEPIQREACAFCHEKLKSADLSKDGTRLKRHATRHFGSEAEIVNAFCFPKSFPRAIGPNEASQLIGLLCDQLTLVSVKISEEDSKREVITQKKLLAASDKRTLKHKKEVERIRVAVGNLLPRTPIPTSNRTSPKIVATASTASSASLSKNTDKSKKDASKKSKNDKSDVKKKHDKTPSV